MALIYVVEDDKNIQEIETFALANVGYEVKGFDSAMDFYEALNDTTPDLILLDIMLPDEDGLSIVKKLRTRQDTVLVPVIMVTAKTTEIDKVKGLDLGADDYITKPFLPEELILRVKAVLKRTYHMEETMKNEQIGAAQVDWNAGVIRNGAEEYALTAKEYTLLRKLSENRGRILSMNVLCDTLWPDGSYGYENSLMVHIRRLREKIEENPSKPEHILTVRGLGYKLI